MTFTAKPIADQVIVITGATSGIGLATAYAAANAGARVVLVARNTQVLNSVAATIIRNGGQALAITADVAERPELQKAADAAIRTYGGIDTWVNNAGTGIFGTVEEVTEADHRRIFEVNYWGLVHGSLIAAALFRQGGGTLVNLGSILSDVSFPLQGHYCATKAAIRAFTDTLRMELEHDNAPVAVSLIKPAAIATPFPEHARNYMNREPKLPPPLYAPEDVATAILHAATHGNRDYYVGGGGKLISMMGKALPRMIDLGGSRLGPTLSKQRRRPSRPTEGNLYAPAADGQVRGEETSPVLRAANPSAGRQGPKLPNIPRLPRSPLAAGAVLALAGVAALLKKR